LGDGLPPEGGLGPTGGTKRHRENPATWQKRSRPEGRLPCLV